MTLFGFLLVFCAAVSHAIWNTCVKRINAGPELVWLFSAIAAVIYLPLAVYHAPAIPGFDARDYLFIIGSTVLHLAYFLLLQLGYRKGDLSLVYPTARATGPVLSTALALLFLGETLTVPMAIGGGIIIFGVLRLTGRARRTTPGAQPNPARSSLMFGVSAGLLIGTYTVWDAHAVAVLLIPPLLLDYATILCRSLLLAPVAHRRRAEVARLWQQHKGLVVTIAIFNPLAYILVLVAFTFTPVVYVAPVRELSVVIAVLLGSLLLGEGHLRHRLTWASIITLGVVILTSS